MRRTWTVGGLVALVLAATAAAAIHAKKPSRPSSRFGIATGGIIQNLTNRERARYFDGVKRAGAGWVRIDINWAVIQRRGARSHDWTPIDRLVRAARRRRLAVLGVIVYTPQWARAAGASASAPPTSLDAYAAFAARAARHFGRRGVHAYEIWNEPNISAGWAPAPDAPRYTQMLTLAYSAIKRVDRSATVISAGLSPYAAYGASDSRGVNPLTFLEQMYARGAHGRMDAVGWHPYSFPAGLGFYTWSGWSQMAATVPSARSIMRANGDGAKRIWATEMGAPTGTSGMSVSEAAQAQLVVDMYARLTAARWAGPAFFYSFRDKGTNPADREDNFGIVRHDWSPKPAYRAYRRIATRGT